MSTCFGRTDEYGITEGPYTDADGQAAYGLRIWIVPHGDYFADTGGLTYRPRKD